MRDYQRELEALREKIARRRDDIAVLESLRRQEEDCRREVEERYAQWDREQGDVERLERLTFSAILSALRGSKDEDMAREKAEAYAAQLRLQEAERQLSEVQAEILDRQRRIQENADCQRTYEALLREKEGELRKAGPVLADQLEKLERQELELTARKRELNEALAAGQQALFCLDAAIGKLDSAEGWGTWDVLGGGLLSDMMKYSRLDEAQSQMEQLRSALRHYQAELADVERMIPFDVRPDGLLSTVDVLFDNIFADWAVLDRISQSKSQLLTVESRIRSIQNGMEQELAETEERLAAICEERNERVHRA